MATYKITPSLAQAKEGQIVETQVETTAIKSGTRLYWSVSGTTIQAADFRTGLLNGQGSVVVAKGATTGSFKFSHTLAADGIQEGDETVQIKLFSDPARRRQLAAASFVIQDLGPTTPSTPSPAPVAAATAPARVTTEIYQPPFTPFSIWKWKSELPVPPLKMPVASGGKPGQLQALGTPLPTTPASWLNPSKPAGGRIARYQQVDPNQVSYGGVADELWEPKIAGTNTPYYTTGDSIDYYEQVHAPGSQFIVDAVDRPRATTVYGYDGQYPGPTFKTKVGAPVVLRTSNQLPNYPGLPAPLFQRVGVHLHGGHNPAHTDGYPSFVVNPAANGQAGMYRDYYYANTVPKISGTNLDDFSESPSTMWYHDHGEDVTDLNVIMGLSGFWLTFDPLELALIKQGKIPGWGDKNKPFNEKEFLSRNSPFDVPLAISDRRFNADGSFYFDGFPIGKDTDGYLGDVQLVNGKAYPYQRVEQTQYRFRMLGASTARIYRLRLETEAGEVVSHLRIGNDTWLNPKPVAMKEFTLSPAQRSDMVVDFSGYPVGSVLYLVNTAEQTSGRGPGGKLDDLGQGTYKERIMKFVVGERGPNTPNNPINNPANPSSLTTETVLRPNIDINASEIAKTRTFAFSRSNGMWVINQTGFSAHTSNNPMPVNTTEEWVLENGSGGWWHPIHIHLESHQLQTINGVAPSPTYWPEKQWKSDTTLLGPNTTARIYMKFRTFEGPFVFHCHNLGHEDSMMMYNFDPHVPFDPAYQDGDPIPHDRDYTPSLYPHRPDGHGPATGPAGVALSDQAAHHHSDHHSNHQQPKPGKASQQGAPTDLSSVQLQAFSTSSWGGKRADRMQARGDSEYLNGRAGDDHLSGFNGNDMLVGGAGDDVIEGGRGHDLIAGEWGADRLTGGSGQDLFRFIAMDDENTDVITDFQPGQDTFCFNLALVNTNGHDSPGWTYIARREFSGRKGEVRFQNGLLESDLDGDGSTDASALLMGVKRFRPKWIAPFSKPWDSDDDDAFSDSTMALVVD